jgi:hypothetical protein
LIPPFCTQILFTLKEKFKINMLFAKIRLCELHEQEEQEQ